MQLFLSETNLLETRTSDLQEVAGSGPAPEVVKVFEELTKPGPVSISELGDRLSIPRISVWKAVKVLHQKGLVEINSESDTLKATKALDRLVSSIRILPNSVWDMRRCFPKLFKSKLFHLQVGLFTSGGDFEIIECTRNPDKKTQPLSLAYDTVAKLVLSRHANAHKNRHIGGFLGKCSQEEILKIQRSLEQELEMLSRYDIVLFREQRQACLSWRSPNGDICGVRLTEKSANNSNHFECGNTFVKALKQEAGSSISAWNNTKILMVDHCNWRP